MDTSLRCRKGNVDPAKKIKHIVILGKQDFVGVDGIDDVEEYNQHEKINLFTNMKK